MEYTVNYGGEAVTLPRYNFKIAEKLEKQDIMNSGNSKFKDKCKSMYDLEKELLGEDYVNRILGKFEDIDPNEINIVYIMIVRAYSSPIEEFNNQDLTNKLDSSKVDKVVDLVNALDKASNMRFTR